MGTGPDEDGCPVTWSYWLCDTITGDLLLEVEPASGSWSRLLNVSGQGRHTFSLGDRLISRDDWRDNTTPWARTLLQCWDDAPVYAGLITGRPYDRDTSMLTLNTTDFRSLLQFRYPWGDSSYWEDEAAGLVGRLVIENKTMVSAVGIVLEQSLIGPVSALATYSLPLVLPSLTDVGSFSTVYENFNFQKTSDILSEIQEMDGGPDIEFSPRWASAGRFEWLARVGALTGGTFEFDLTSPTSPVSSVKVAEDALKQVTGVIGVGEGSGPTIIVGGGYGGGIVTPADIPSREETAVWRMVKTIPDAVALSIERLAAYKYPTVQPGLTVQASEVSPADLVLGSTVTLIDDGDPFLPDGESDWRLIGLSGGVEGELTLNVQGVRE